MAIGVTLSLARPPQQGAFDDRQSRRLLRRLAALLRAVVDYAMVTMLTGCYLTEAIPVQII